uniref:PRESAN domain-containing protein n=1 Tax=Heterorhabditis bacteriophora TaxID=37862 RepID=A0A1I7XCG6_HETBA
MAQDCQSGFLLQSTIAGNAVYGSGTLTDSTETQDHCAHNMYIIKEEDPDLRKLLRSFYYLEGLGITEDQESKEEETFQYMGNYSKLMQFTTECDNFNIVYRRLNNLLESLRSKREQIHWYEKILQSYIKHGIIDMEEYGNRKKSLP